ncbi:MAG: phosphoribosylglycinamide formyltransferase [Nanoarchaeota archaeon]|nr:phosphoribosylglycinamide formyltransferase [Nanoarchaeota archaeon]
MATVKLAVLGSTRGTDLQFILDKIQARQLDASVSVVVSNKRDAYILERAKNHGIPAVFVDSKGKTREEFDKEVLKSLESYKPDLILLIGYMRILSSAFVRAYKGRILNVHPSLLPAYAGGMDLDVYRAMLKNKETVGGITIHLVDEGVDTGRILLQKKYAIVPGDSPETMKEKAQKLEGEAFVETLALFSQGTLKVHA